MTIGSQHNSVFSDADNTEQMTHLQHEDSERKTSDSHIQQMNQFKLTRQLGHGGGGTVFAAKDLKLHRDVAIKMLRLDNHQHNQAILHEARIQAQIDHPNICKIFQVIEGNSNEQSSYLVMQLISGKPANQWREQQDELDINHLIAWIRQVCSGLQALHGKDIIHKDIKPSNIMLDSDKYGQIHPYIVDFGIANQQMANLEQAKPEDEQKLNGTPSYMSPEQFKNNTLDYRSDIFSLGATMYHLLTNIPPTRSSTNQNLEHNFEHPDWQALPNEIKLIIAKCMAFNPDERFQSVKALNDELGRYLHNEALQINTNKAYRLRKRVLKNRWPIILFTSLSVLVISFISWREWQNQQQVHLQQQLAASLTNTKNIENLITIQRLSPPEDLSSKIETWTEQLDQIAAQIQLLPKKIRGQGFYNIGKIHYDLQNYQQALHFLNKAWQNQYRQPIVAYHLAITHGTIYQQQKQFTELMANISLKPQRLYDSTNHHKSLALEFLALGIKAAPSTEYAKALHHFYNDQYTQASNQLKSIQTLPNSSYQHLTLHGDINIAKAKRDNQTSIERASFYAQQAIDYYHEAQRKGRSDLYLYLKSFHAYSVLLEKNLYGKTETFNNLFNQAMEQINIATKIMPNDYQAYYFKGLFLARKSKFDDQHNNQALETQSKAVVNLEKALKLSNQDPSVQLSLAVAYAQLLYLHVQNKLPVNDLMNITISAFSDIPKNYREYYYHNNFGTLHYSLGRYFSSVQSRTANQLSTDIYFTTALHHFDIAQQLQPRKIGAKNNAVIAQYYWADIVTRARAHEIVEQALQRLSELKYVDESHKRPFNINKANGYNKLANIRAALSLDFSEQLQHAKHYINSATEGHILDSNVIAELSKNSALALIYHWQQGVFDTDILLETKQSLDIAFTQRDNNKRDINSAAWLYQIEQQLFYLTHPNIQASTSYNKAIEFATKQGAYNQETLLLLKLLNGQWQEIPQQTILALKKGEYATLIRALWYSSAKHFERANTELEDLKMMPKSIVWTYKLKNLNRWQQSLQQQGEPSATLERVIQHKTTIQDLLKTTYPKLFELLNPPINH